MRDTNRKSVKVLAAVTVSDSVIFFYGMPSYLRERGMTVAIASSRGPELDQIIAKEDPIIFPIEMAREPSPFRDLASLARVMATLVRFRPDIVNAGTPKAGLIYILAAWLFRVKYRVYHLRGLRHESLTGFAETLQIRIEKLVGRLATHIICETESLRDISLEQGLYAKEKCHVLGPGSSGVELENYDPATFPADVQAKMREDLGIPGDARVIGFVGRLVPRKGVDELVAAWTSGLSRQYPDARLLLVGPMEDAQPLASETRAAMAQDPRIILTGKVDNVAQHLSVMDVFTLPAHWEGFGNVVVEAASMGLPVVTTTGTGTRDAAKDGYNAILIPPKDVAALTTAIATYVDDPDLRAQHGANGIEWSKRFERQEILRHLAEFYQGLG